WRRWSTPCHSIEIGASVTGAAIQVGIFNSKLHRWQRSRLADMGRSNLIHAGADSHPTSLRSSTGEVDCRRARMFASCVGTFTALMTQVCHNVERIAILFQ